MEFKKFLDYKIGLNFAYLLPEKLGFYFVKKRGEKIFEREKRIVEKIIKNLIEVLNIDKNKAEKISKKIFMLSSFEEFFGLKLAKKEINFIEKKVHLKNEEFLKEIIKKYKRGVFVLIHEGFFLQSLCKIAYRFNIKINAIAWPYFEAESKVFKNFIGNKIEGMKYFTKGEFFFVGYINPRKLYEKLNNNEFLAIAIDSPLGRSSKVEINFFNTKKYYPVSAFKIGLKTNSPIIPIYQSYDFNLNVINTEILTPFFIKNKDEISFKISEIFKKFEEKLKKEPEQYFYWSSPSSWATIK